MQTSEGDTRRVLLHGLVLVLVLAVALAAADGERAQFVSVDAPQVALEHVDVIDGRGTPIQRNQTMVIERGRIAAIGPADIVTVPAGAMRLPLSGHTVLPGLVGMHNHLFYAVDGGRRYINGIRSAARLYLASGVTTIRTAGSVDAGGEQTFKQRVSKGLDAGPRIHYSGHYLNGTREPSAWATEVEGMAGAGVTSLKAYTDVRRADLAAIISSARRHGLRVTAHLCAVTFREAAALGIDNLEHGLIVDSGLHPTKKPDECPPAGEIALRLAQLGEDAAEIQSIIGELVSRRVAITSTLAVFDSFTAHGAMVDPRVERFLAPPALEQYRAAVRSRSGRGAELTVWRQALEKEMAFERRFARAGGLLVAGADPTGWGGTLPGLADQRNLELLVEAGFTASEAVQVATSNGATLLSDPEVVGVIAAGNPADLVVVQGDLAADVQRIRDVRFVFKDGIGFDPDALASAEHGRFGLSQSEPMAPASSPVKMVILAAVALVVLLAVSDRLGARRRGRRPTTPG